MAGQIRVVGIHQPGPVNLVRAFIFAHQRHAAGFAPEHLREAVFQLDNLDGPGGERGGEHHYAVTIIDLLRRIAAVQRLHPHDGGRRTGRAPVMLARLHRHAAGADILGGPHDIHARHFRILIPHLHAAREILNRCLIRIRRMHPFDQHIAAVRRHIEPGKNGFTADAHAVLVARVHQRQLRGQIIIEELFIMVVLDEVRKGEHRGLLRTRFLHHRSGGSARRCGQLAARGGHREAHQVSTVRQPLERAPHCGVQLHASHLANLPCAGVTHPQADLRAVVLHERKLPTVRRPHRQAESPRA